MFKYSIAKVDDIPCKEGCPNRTPGCHDKCESYITWKKEHLDKKAVILENRKKQSEATAFFKQMSDVRKRRKGEKDGQKHH